jgi:hypothetical protein
MIGATVDHERGIKFIDLGQKSNGETGRITPRAVRSEEMDGVFLNPCVGQ